ncbi:MAG TPA: restriction endonuclease [Saprospiraceae bacterium]|nr:restriction endonuclease [Saprospiraceae bacterium]
MDFNQLDIRRFLIGALPGRFSQVSPSDFESFIDYLFHVDGYRVERISKKSDLTANLIAKKDDTTLVIRIMRSLQDQMIGELEVQEAIAAKDFYETDQSWIITTSGFTQEAKTLAENAEIELWDWDALNLALSELFFEGRNYLEFVDTHRPPVTISGFEPVMKLKVKWEAQEGVGVKWFNLSLTLSNPTDENLYVHLDLPVLIDKQKNQISAEKWADEEFIAGMIYAGASVRTNALFKTSKLGERPPGGKIVLTCHEREPPVTYHLSSKLKGEACYFVAYCYSRQSQEYVMMSGFRDQELSRTFLGRKSIEAYYLISPFLVQWAGKIKIVDYLLRKLTAFAVDSVRKFNLSKTGDLKRKIHHE